VVEVVLDDEGFGDGDRLVVPDHCVHLIGHPGHELPCRAGPAAKQDNDTEQQKQFLAAPLAWRRGFQRFAALRLTLAHPRGLSVPRSYGGHAFCENLPSRIFRKTTATGLRISSFAKQRQKKVLRNFVS